MKWNVYIYNVNHQKIEVHNIFEHRGLQEEIKKIISEYTIKDEFAERLKSELRYYYKSRAEWEIIVAPWVGNKNLDEEKIDVWPELNLMEVVTDIANEQEIIWFNSSFNVYR